jgi:hypothetical protein
MKRSHRLCIIPCGTRKIWQLQPALGSVEAERAYLSTYHKLCKAYAEHFHYRWVILSAKHGFLDPQDPVDGMYDVSFNKPDSGIISFDELRRQAADKGLDKYPDVQVLAGRKYRAPVAYALGNSSTITYPFERYKGIGYIQQALKRAIEDNVELEMESDNG